MATILDLIDLNIRVGKIVKADFFAEAKVPAYKLEIDFGPLGMRQSSAQLSRRYDAAKLTGRKIVAVLGLPPKRIAGFQSECLVLGSVDGEGDVILLDPGQDTELGWPIQ